MQTGPGCGDQGLYLRAGLARQGLWSSLPWLYAPGVCLVSTRGLCVSGTIVHLVKNKLGLGSEKVVLVRGLHILSAWMVSASKQRLANRDVERDQKRV